jgi:hypothetical protein
MKVLTGRTTGSGGGISLAQPQARNVPIKTVLSDRQNERAKQRRNMRTILLTSCAYTVRPHALAKLRSRPFCDPR